MLKRFAALPLACLLTLVLTLAVASPAVANTYCVPSGGAGCTSEPDLQSALTAAQSHNGADTVTLAAGTYSATNCASAGGFSYTGGAGNPVAIVGAGADTMLTCPTNYDNGGSYHYILVLDGGTLTGVQIHLPSGNYDRGLALEDGSSADQISITSDVNALDGAIGTELLDSSLSNSSVAISPTDDGEAAQAFDGSTLDDVTLSGGGVGLLAGGAPGSTISHARVTSDDGIEDTSGDLSVYDTAITLVHGAVGSPVGLQLETFGSGTASLLARGVSIGTVEPGADGVEVSTSHSGTTDDLTLEDTAMTGTTTALERFASAGGTANLTADYDDYPAGSYGGTGPGATTETNDLHDSPGFVNAGDGDFTLAAGSPLIDAGTPGALTAGEPTTDLAGAPRILAGNGSCTARRDIGAYEYVPATLPAAASAPPSGSVGLPVTFQAAGCSTDPAATAFYTWAFDDGGTASGAEVSHTFATPGLHHASLTITDTDGHSGTATTAVTISQPAHPTPALGKLKLTPARFAVRQPRHHRKIRLGTKITYTDTLPATTSFTITQSAPGLLNHHRCVARPRHPKRGARRCTRTITLGSFNHHDRAGGNTLTFNGRLGRHLLASGRYRLTVIARLNHRTSRASTTTFVVTG